MSAEIRINVRAQPEGRWYGDWTTPLCVACSNPYRPAIDDMLLYPLMPPRS